MAIFASNIIVKGQKGVELNASTPVLPETTDDNIAKEKVRIEKEKRAQEIQRRIQEAQENREITPEKLTIFKESSEETKSTFIIDKDSEYMTDIIK